MQRPIEKCGWEFTGTYSLATLRRECFKRHGHEIRIDHEGNIMMLNKEPGFDFEELQAIYKTARQIRKECGRTKKDSRV